VSPTIRPEEGRTYAVKMVDSCSLRPIDVFPA
jgi:hypothetical protein